MAQEKTNDEPESGFAILSEMVRLDVSFTAIGNLSIMSGSGDGILDNTVQRTGSEPHDFAITGSTLKGVTRSTIEAILAGCEDVCAPMACAPKGETIKGRLSDCGEVIRIAKREKKPIPQDVPCSICQMFGSTSQKGRVVFHDAPIQTQEKAIQRTHVAIDRETGTASPRALTTIETIPRGPEFVGSVGFTNPEDWMIGAMIYVLETIIPQIGLGAKTTSGYGQLDVKVGDPKFVLFPKDHSPPDPKAFREDCRKAWYDKGKILLPQE